MTNVILYQQNPWAEIRGTSAQKNSTQSANYYRCTDELINNNNDSTKMNETTTQPPTITQTMPGLNLGHLREGPSITERSIWATGQEEKSEGCINITEQANPADYGDDDFKLPFQQEFPDWIHRELGGIWKEEDWLIVREWALLNSSWQSNFITLGNVIDDFFQFIQYLSMESISDLYNRVEELVSPTGTSRRQLVDSAGWHGGRTQLDDTCKHPPNTNGNDYSGGERPTVATFVSYDEQDEMEEATSGGDYNFYNHGATLPPTASEHHNLAAKKWNGTYSDGTGRYTQHNGAHTWTKVQKSIKKHLAKKNERKMEKATQWGNKQNKRGGIPVPPTLLQPLPNGNLGRASMQNTPDLSTKHNIVRNGKRIIISTMECKKKMETKCNTIEQQVWMTGHLPPSSTNESWNNMNEQPSTKGHFVRENETKNTITRHYQSTTDTAVGAPGTLAPD